jgi:signal transduction histidine kinase
MQASADNISSIIFTITCIFLLAAVFLLFYVWLYNKRKKRHVDEKMNLQLQFQQQLQQSQVEVQESTYASLGKELHDNVGQLLGTAKILLGITERKLDVVPDTLITASQTISKAIQEIRSLAKILSVEWLQQFSFSENLVAEVQRINTAELIQVTLINEEKYLPLNAEEQIILFRILQEALQNAIKHADATTIAIQLTLNENLLCLSIADNGKGFERETVKPVGTGLLNMQHRIQLLGGSITWQKKQGGGTIVYINLPVTVNHTL